MIHKKKKSQISNAASVAASLVDIDLFRENFDSTDLFFFTVMFKKAK